MKIAIIYTAKSDELTNSLHTSIKNKFGKDVEIAEYQDVTALTEAAKAGKVTAKAAALYGKLLLQAVEDGANGILSTCCVMGDVVESLHAFLKFAGVAVLSIDEPFCKAALLKHKKICLLATAAPAATSVAHTLDRYKNSLNANGTFKTVIVTGTAGLKGDVFSQKIWEAAEAQVKECDGFVLAQPSMAGAADYLRKKSGKAVYCATDDPVTLLKVK